MDIGLEREIGEQSSKSSQINYIHLREMHFEKVWIQPRPQQ